MEVMTLRLYLYQRIALGIACFFILPFHTFTSTSHADAYEVSGELDVVVNKQPAAKPQTPQFYWEEWNGLVPLKPQKLEALENMVVVLTGSSEAAAKTGSTVKVWGYTLRPRTIVQSPGTTLTIVNGDPSDYELEGTAPSVRGVLQPKNSRIIRLDKTGVFTFRDKRFPEVDGTIHVVRNIAAVASVSRTQRYQFEAVPEGDYTLEVFYGSQKAHQKQIHVGPAALDNPKSRVKRIKVANARITLGSLER